MKSNKRVIETILNNIQIKNIFSSLRVDFFLLHSILNIQWSVISSYYIKKICLTAHSQYGTRGTLHIFFSTNIFYFFFLLCTTPFHHQLQYVYKIILCLFMLRLFFCVYFIAKLFAFFFRAILSQQMSFKFFFCFMLYTM